MSYCTRDDDHVEAFVSVALAKVVPRLPSGAGWWYEPKLWTGFVVSAVRPVMLSKPSSIETVHDLVSAATVTVRP
jgi:hypothetical protein